MHYADGTEVKLGDLAISSPPQGNVTELLGIVVAGTVSSTSCNLQLMPFAARVRSSIGTGPWSPIYPANPWCVTAGECHKVTVPEPAPKPAA